MRSLFFLPLVFFPTLLFAAEYTANRDVELIHNVIIKIPGDCCPLIYLSTKVGHLENGVCQYEKETPPRSYGYCGPEQSYPLDGEQLARMVGMGYDCAATVASDQSNQMQGVDAYHLTGAEDKYIATSPESGMIELGIQCSGKSAKYGA